MRKILYLSIFLLSILMISCKPDPIDNGDDDTNNTDTIQEEPLVRKYLVREYWTDRDKPIFIIDWNDDFTRIEHLITDSGTMYQVNYHFQYYDEDSIRIYITLPEVNQGMYMYTNYTCHMNDGRISKIDMYYNEKYKDTRDYKYDDKNRLIEAGGTSFVWDNNNVTKICYSDDTINYYKTGNYIHPYYTLPYLLPSCSYFTTFGTYITKPLWRNFWEYPEQYHYKFDIDGYVTNVYYKTVDSVYLTYINYEYDY